MNTNSINKVRLLYPDLSYKLQGCFYKVYNTLGFGHKEIAYQRALEQELSLQGIPFEKEVHLGIKYNGKKIAEYVPDLVIDKKIIVEIKALEFLPAKLTAQLIHYLKGTNYQLGYLVNFGASKLEIIRRIWTPRISVNSLPIRENPTTKAFTLLELLIVIGLIALLLTAALILFNPKRQIERAWDAQRKHDLAILRKVIEDYYNDKDRYPNAAEICYPDTFQQVGDVCSCFICGKAAGSPTFSPYLTKLPCDPEHPAKNYFYEYDCLSTQISWYRTYAKLAEVTSIGPYNYCRSSDNIDCPLSPTPTPTPVPTAAPTATPTIGPSPTPTPIFCPNDPTAKYCYKETVCNNCGTFTQCQLSTKCSQPTQLYSDFACSVPCSAKAVTPTVTPTPTSTPTLPPSQPTCPADPTAKYCFKGTLCNNCSNFANCNSPGICNSPLQLYSDFNCINPCKQ